MSLVPNALLNHAVQTLVLIQPTHQVDIFVSAELTIIGQQLVEVNIHCFNLSNPMRLI